LSGKYEIFTENALERRLKIREEGREAGYKKLINDKANIVAGRGSIKEATTKVARSKVVNKSDNDYIALLAGREEYVTEEEDVTQTPLNNYTDIRMVLDILANISETDAANIYNNIAGKLENEGIEKTFEYLDGFFAIGDKIASFILRDIILIKPDRVIKGFDASNPAHYGHVFPIDTWVRQIYKTIEGEKFNGDEDIKVYFIEGCLKMGLRPPLVAAGIWRAGAKSLDVLFGDFFKYYEIRNPGR
jgi:hypothetical protein